MPVVRCSQHQGAARESEMDEWIVLEHLSTEGYTRTAVKRRCIVGGKCLAYPEMFLDLPCGESGYSVY